MQRRLYHHLVASMKLLAVNGRSLLRLSSLPGRFGLLNAHAAFRIGTRSLWVNGTFHRIRDMPFLCFRLLSKYQPLYLRIHDRNISEWRKNWNIREAESSSISVYINLENSSPRQSRTSSAQCTRHRPRESNRHHRQCISIWTVLVKLKPILKTHGKVLV